MHIILITSIIENKMDTLIFGETSNNNKTWFWFTWGTMLFLNMITPTGDIEWDYWKAKNPAAEVIKGKAIEMSTKFNHRKPWLDDQTHIELTKKKRPIVEDDWPKWDSTKMYFWYAQLRSVDEGQTVFHECVQWGYIYSINT